MFNKILFVALVLCCCGTVMAQEQPKAELFGGYAYQRSLQYNFQGWNASIMANINPWLGFGADFCGTYDTAVKAGLHLGMNIHSVLFGPQFSRRTDEVTAFAHVLLGANHISAGIDPLIRIARARLAFMVGGGLDINLNQRIAARVFQVDYHSAWGDGGRNEGFRFSAGLVIKIK